jgi:predicted site-specific integrase-resolvase
MTRYLTVREAAASTRNSCAIGRTTGGHDPPDELWTAPPAEGSDVRWLLDPGTFGEQRHRFDTLCENVQLIYDDHGCPRGDVIHGPSRRKGDNVRHIDSNRSPEQVRAAAIVHESSLAGHITAVEPDRADTTEKRPTDSRTDRLRVAFYARAGSTPSRDDLARQLRSCRSASSRMASSTTVGVFTDHGHAHASAARPGFKALMEAARARTFDAVLIENPDRLSRDQDQWDWIFRVFEEYGVAVISTDLRFIRRENVFLRGVLASKYRAVRL